MSAGMEGGKEINGEDKQAQEGKEDQKRLKMQQEEKENKWF